MSEMSPEKKQKNKKKISANQKKKPIHLINAARK